MASINPTHCDVPYAQGSAAQRLDLYLPGAGEGPYPVIVFVHGGAFAMDDKADDQVRPWLGAPGRGYALASVNYRLSGEAVFPAGLHDVKAAIRFLKAHAQEYRLDPRRVAVCGDSAGGYYAAMACLTADRPELEDLALGSAAFSSTVQAAVDWFGPTDFLRMDANWTKPDWGRAATVRRTPPNPGCWAAGLRKYQSLWSGRTPSPMSLGACRPC